MNLQKFVTGVKMSLYGIHVHVVAKKSLGRRLYECLCRFTILFTLYIFAFFFLTVFIDSLQPKDRACCVCVPHTVRWCKGKSPADVPPGWGISPGPPAARVSASRLVSSDESTLSFVGHGSPAGRDEQSPLSGHAQTNTQISQAQRFGVSQSIYSDISV